MMRVVKPWSKLPRLVVAAPSLGTPQARLDRALSDLIWVKMSLPMAEGLDQMTSKQPFQPKAFYDFHPAHPTTSSLRCCLFPNTAAEEKARRPQPLDAARPPRARSVPPLTIRQRGDRHILGGDAGAVAVVGEEAQGVLGELLQPLQPVGEPVHLHVLAHRDDKPQGNVTTSAMAMPRDEWVRGELFTLRRELNP